jgi:hypothetical protein
VVERTLDVSHAVTHILPLLATGTTPASLRLGHDGNLSEISSRGRPQDCVPGKPELLPVNRLLTDLLLARNCLAGTLAGTCIRVGALTTDRKSTTMTHALVAADFDLALDVLRYVATQVAFDLHLGVDVTANADNFFIG